MASQRQTDTTGNLKAIKVDTFFKPGHSYPMAMSNFRAFPLKACCSFEKYNKSNKNNNVNTINNSKPSKQQTDTTGTTDATDVQTLPPLLRLPAELTENIAKFIRGKRSRSSMSDLCAFRSTCKDINLKTFQEFGERYFSTISVGFNRTSLQRLRDIAQHKNTLGLSLAEFPKYLVVSTHRLLADGDLFQMSEDIDSSLSDAYWMVAGISNACRLGYGDLGELFNPNRHPIVEQYVAALRDQRMITSTKFDVESIAQALAAFPQFAYLTLNSLKRIRGQDDWHALAGITSRSFTRSGDPDTGYSNTTFAFDRVLQAIAQAQGVCEPQGRSLNLRILGAQSESCYFDDEDTDLRQHISLQDLDIGPSAGLSLSNAFSKLERLELDLYDFIPPGNLEKDAEKIKSALIYEG